MDTKALRQKILDLAIRGKLVPQDPNDEPAEVLLKRIREQKQQMLKEGKLKKKDIKNDTIIFKGEDNLHYEKFQDGTVKCIEDEIPFEVPEGWEWCRLPIITTDIFAGGDKPDICEKRATEICNIPIYSNGIENDGLYGYTNKPRVTEPSITISARGTIGFCCARKTPFVPIVRLITITPSKEISLYYLKTVFKALIETGEGSSIPQLTVPGIKLKLIPIPPIMEQDRIQSKQDEILKYISDISFEKDKLRRIVQQAKNKILDLAIHGKLVPQDPNDEPASVLLERIRAEKEELIKQGKIKRDKKESVIFKGDDNSYYLRTELETMEIADELPYEIPESWEWARIGNVFQVNPRNKLDDLLEVSFIPMPLIDDGFSGKHTSEVRVWKKIKSGFTHFTEGDIGIAKITPCFENRKSVVFRNLKNNYGAGTTELHVLRPYASSILPEYVLAYVKSSMFIDKGKQEFTGAVGQQRIGKDYVENSYFPIPPLAEQKRIVEQISTVYKQLDLISNALC